MVFLRQGWTEEDIADLRRYRDEEGWDRRQVERLYNHTGVWLVFAPTQPRITDEEEEQLVGILAEAWRAWLVWRYPARRFTVEVIGPEGDAENVVPFEDCLTLTFSEDR